MRCINEALVPMENNTLFTHILWCDNIRREDIVRYYGAEVA